MANARETARRVVLVSHLPLSAGNMVRWRSLAEYLPRHGWEVDPLTARIGLTGDPLSPDPRVAYLSGRRAAFVSWLSRRSRGLAARVGIRPEALAPNFLWAYRGRASARRAARRLRPDVVVGTSIPVSGLLLGAYTARAAGVPYVADLREVWASHPGFDAGGSALRRVEAPALRSAAAIVCVTDAMADRVRRVHPDCAQRVHVLPNGFDPRLLEMRTARRVADRGRVRFIHAGSFPFDRSVDVLLAAMSSPDVASRVELELVGNLTSEVEAAARAAAVPVALTGTLGWAETMEHVRDADIAVIVLTPSSDPEIAWPGKMFEALALGKPVLALTPGGAAEDLLRTLGQGAGTARYDDPGDVSAAIERLLRDPPEPVDRERLARFDRSRVAADYAALLDSVAG